MLKLLLFFTRRIFYYNLLVSLLALVIIMVPYIMITSSYNLETIFTGLIIIMLTLGYGFGVFLFYLFHKHELPFYRNYGLSFLKSAGMAFGIHLSIGIMSILIAHNLPVI